MKIHYFLHVLFCLKLTVLPAQNWTQQNSGTSQHLKDVFFVDANLGFVSGDSGILKTTNGGISWSEALASTGIVKIHFPSAGTGYAGKMSNVGLLKTTDGGNNWTDKSLNISGYSGGGIWFTSEDTGFFAIGNFSSGSKILKTTNGGLSWDTVLSVSTSIWISYFYFPDDNTGYATGSGGYVYKTTDAGSSWTTIFMGGNYWMSGVYFFDNNKGFVSGGNLGGGVHPIWKTSDGGANWQIVFSISIGNSGISNIAFQDTLQGYALLAGNTGYGTMYSTSDGGNNWIAQSVPGDSLYKIHFPSANVGYAVGKNGTILKTFSPFGIYGTIYDQNQTASLNYGKVFLLRYDSFAVKLNHVDSFILGGGNGDYFFTGHSEGSYLILARPDETMYPNFIPTYFGDTAYWENAQVLYLLSDSSGMDIHAREIPTWSGTGFCSGTVRFGIGSGKTGDGNENPFGDPVPGIDVSIEQNPGGVIKAHTTTNDSGFYSFSNIPLNTSFKLLVDIPGLPMNSSYDVNITAAASSAMYLDFVVDTSSDGTEGIYPGYPLGIKSQVSNLKSQISIYPNPGNGKIQVSSYQYPVRNIEVYNVPGEKIYSAFVTCHSLVIDISSEPKGIYFIQVKTEEGMWIGKVVVE